MHWQFSSGRRQCSAISFAFVWERNLNSNQIWIFLNWFKLKNSIRSFSSLDISVFVCMLTEVVLWRHRIQPPWDIAVSLYSVSAWGLFQSLCWLFYCHTPPAISQQAWVPCKWLSKTSRLISNPFQRGLHWKTEKILSKTLCMTLRAVSKVYNSRLPRQDHFKWSEGQMRKKGSQGCREAVWPGSGPWSPA